MALAATVSASGGAAGYAQHFLIAGDQVPVFIQVADDLDGGLANFRAQAQRADLPHQVIG